LLPSQKTCFRILMCRSVCPEEAHWVKAWISYLDLFLCSFWSFSTSVVTPHLQEPLRKFDTFRSIQEKAFVPNHWPPPFSVPWTKCPAKWLASWGPITGCILYAGLWFDSSCTISTIISKFKITMAEFTPSMHTHSPHHWTWSLVCFIPNIFSLPVKTSFYMATKPPHLECHVPCGGSLCWTMIL
jgi:hypothetical protein